MAERENRVKSNSYYSVHGWMINELGLKGTQLAIYAIINGFSQDSAGCYNGSLQYLMDWTGCSKPTVINALKSLVDMGLLDKKEIVQNGIKFVSYRVKKFDWGGKKTLPGVVKKFNQGGKKTLPGVVKKFNQGGKKTLPNNIVDNIDIYNSNNIAQSGKSAHEPDEQKAIFIIPLINGDYPITQSSIDEWQELYPNVDVPQAIRNMIGWCNANPTKRKTNRGIKRFINNWLAGDQDSGKNQRKKVCNNAEQESVWSSVGTV